MCTGSDGPLWVEFRSSIRTLGYRHNRWGDTSFFVGGWSGTGKDGEEKAWKSNGEAVWATINFAISTGRLESRKEETEIRATQRQEGSEASDSSDTSNGA